MKKNLTEIVFVLDRSGSMCGLEEDTIGGFNSLLAEQRKKDGEVLVSTVLFNQMSEVIYDRVPLDKIEDMTRNQYRVGGSTALVDALGDAIHHIGMVYHYIREEDVPEHTIFVVTTDGMENASRRYTADKVREMVKKEQEQYGWEFLFLGANIDAVGTAANYGIRADRAVRYECDSEGTRKNFEAVSCAMSCMRENASISKDWAAPAEEYYKEVSKRRSHRSDPRKNR